MINKGEHMNSAPYGFHIVVLDKGFVYVGNLSWDGGWGTIKDARNIRYWGTTKGLGQLRKGPTKKTKLDDSGDVIFPFQMLVLCIPTKASLWE
jgi:hypothetical protein